MQRVLAVTAIAAAALAVAAPASLAQGDTTSPGTNFKIHVYISDGGVVLSRSVAKRGWLAHFIITNKGKKAHVFDIGGLKTKPIAPGQTTKLGANLDTRGQYAYKIDNKIRGYFVVQ